MARSKAETEFREQTIAILSKLDTQMEQQRQTMDRFFGVLDAHTKHDDDRFEKMGKEQGKLKGTIQRWTGGLIVLQGLGIAVAKSMGVI